MQLAMTLYISLHLTLASLCVSHFIGYIAVSSAMFVLASSVCHVLFLTSNLLYGLGRSCIPYYQFCLPEIVVTHISRHCFNSFAVSNTAKYSPPMFEKADNQKHDWEILKGLVSALTGKPEDETTPELILDMALKSGYYKDEGMSLEKLLESYRCDPVHRRLSLGACCWGFYLKLPVKTL